MEKSVQGPVVFGSVTLGASLVLGALVAFLMGAHAGSHLDHTTRSVGVAHPHVTPPPPLAQR
jgi:hypothetical protein